MKKLFVVLAALALAGGVQASELWWTVSGAPTDGWTEAKLFANTTGYNYDGELVGSVTKTDLDNFGDAFTQLGDFDSAAYSFYVELFNGTESIGQKSYVSLSSPAQGSVAYGKLADSIAKDTMDWAGKSVYTGFSQFTDSNVIPEPTSGLLVMLGMMMLGLKRKRV